MATLVTLQDINARVLDPTDKQLEVDKMSTVSGLTATAGGGQANALLLANHFNRVTTVATAADSVKLPPAVVGVRPIVVANAAAANSMNVFPSTGDAINALAVNTAFAMAANKCAIFFCFVNGVWTSVLTA